MTNDDEFDPAEFEEVPTNLDAGAIPEAIFREPSTAPHDVAEWMGGWARGYGDGIDAYEQALRSELRRNSSATPESQDALLAHLRMLVELG